MNRSIESRFISENTGSESEINRKEKVLVFI
jgi:hypothetical protein